MGMTLTTLSLFDADAAAIAPLLAPTDLLRTQNPPWLTIVPSAAQDAEPMRRFETLAKRLTKDTARAALLFFYFDDDQFTCTLFQGGKKSASCGSESSWARLGKQLDALFGDELASSAFRYAQRCCSLEEQVQLLEEALGAAVYDAEELPPRAVERGSAVFHAVKTREAQLRKRPNQFVLAPVAPAQWPEFYRLYSAFFAYLKPQAAHDASVLSALSNFKARILPGYPRLVAYPYSKRQREAENYLLLYDAAADTFRSLGPFEDSPGNALWRTKGGALVVQFAHWRTVQHDDTSFNRFLEGVDVRCILPDGSELWRFTPEVPRGRTIEHVRTAPDGTITLFVSGNGFTDTEARIWQLDGETGALVRSVRLPGEADVLRLAYAEAAGVFAYVAARKTLVLLNDALEEIRRLPYSGSVYFDADDFSSRFLLRFTHPRTIQLMDLHSGAVETHRLELPGYPLRLLEDGRILAVTEHFASLLVFDRAGALLARCKLPPAGKLLLFGHSIPIFAHIRDIILDDHGIYIVEQREPNTNGFLFDGYFDHVSNQLWQLVPAAQAKKSAKENA